MNISELKEELTPVQLLPSYVKVDGYEVVAGKAVVDMKRRFVIRNVSPDYELVTTYQLIKWLKSFRKLRFIDLYKTKSLGDNFIKGWFPEDHLILRHGLEAYIAFEIAVSYSSRFLPMIKAGLYLPKTNLFIRTNEDLTVNFTRQEVKKDIFNSNLDFNIDTWTKVKDLFESEDDWRHMPPSRQISQLLKQLPAQITAIKLKGLVKSLVEDSKLNTPLGYLSLVAHISKIWERTAYETARNFQLNAYETLNLTLSEKEKNEVYK